MSIPSYGSCPEGGSGDTLPRKITNGVARCLCGWQGDGHARILSRETCLIIDGQPHIVRLMPPGDRVANSVVRVMVKPPDGGWTTVAMLFDTRKAAIIEHCGFKDIAAVDNE